MNGLTNYGCFIPAQTQIGDLDVFTSHYLFYVFIYQLKFTNYPLKVYVIIIIQFYYKFVHIDIYLIFQESKIVYLTS